MKHTLAFVAPLTLFVSACDSSGNSGSGPMATTSGGKMVTNPKSGSAPALKFDPNAPKNPALDRNDLPPSPADVSKVQSKGQVPPPVKAQLKQSETPSAGGRASAPALKADRNMVTTSRSTRLTAPPENSNLSEPARR